MSEFWSDTYKKIKSYHSNVKICVFGHLGDGNLHYNLMDQNPEEQYVKGNQSILKELVYEQVSKFSGSFSAEPGIGQLKINELKKYKEKNTFELIKRLKKSMDPQNIMNPGKIFY